MSSDASVYFDLDTGEGRTQITCPLCDGHVAVELSTSGRRYANGQLMVGVRKGDFEDHLSACIDRELNRAVGDQS